MLANIEDVEKRLGFGVEPDEQVKVEGLLEEASALVEAHVGRVFTDVPDAVRIVTSRMVARVLVSPEETQTADSVSYGAQGFSKSLSYSHGGSGGAPWLTAVDKKMLRPYGGRRGGVYSVEMG